MTSAGTRLATALPALLVDRHARFEQALAGVLRDAAPEHVHRCRVVARGLRSIAGTLDGALAARRGAALRGDLKTLAGMLGPMREADVRRAWLLGLAARERLAPGLREPLAAALDRECAATRRRFGRRAGTADFAACRARVAGAVADPRLFERPGPELQPLLLRRLRKRWKRLLATLAGAPLDTEALHAVRLRCKHARYATEALVELCGGDAGRLVKPLRRLQACLGDHRDALEARLWLESLGAPLGPALLARLDAPIRKRLGRRLREYRRLRESAALRRAAGDLAEAAPPRG